MDLDIANYKENSDISEKVVLYSRDTQEAWSFDTNNKNLSVIDLQDTMFKCILMDDEGRMVTWGKEICYWDIDESPIGHENLLIE